MSCHRRLRDDERGVTIILVALALVGMLIMAGLVLDFGVVRTDRQSNKAAADFATTAGLRGLDVGDGVPRPFRGVCEAFRYLKANRPEMSGLTGSLTDGNDPPTVTHGITGGDPCTASAAVLDTKCVANTKSSWAWYRGTARNGELEVDIKSGYELTDGGFKDENYTSDPGDASLGNCDHLAVIVKETQDTSFGILAGRDTLSTTIRSVGRAKIDDETPAAVALLLLEQHDCKAVEIKGGGNEGEILVYGVVDPVDPTISNPGMMHADSDGTTNCGNNEEVLEGRTKNNVPLLRAEPDPTCTSPPVFPPLAPPCTDLEKAGIVSTYAAEVAPGTTIDAFWTNSRTTSHVWSCGLAATCSIDPVGSDRITRSPGDDRYLEHMRALRTTALGVLNSASAPAGYTAFSTCNVNSAVTAAPVAPATGVWVNCPNGLSVANGGGLTISTGGGPVAFTGPIDIKGGGVLDIPDANAIYVQGGTQNPGDAGIAVDGVLQLRNGATLSAGGCPDGTSADTSTIVLRRGALRVGSTGSASICWTMVHLMGGYRTGQTWNDGFIPDPDNPTATYPAPYTSSMIGRVNTQAGGAMSWTAPNRTLGPPSASDIAAFEDLALWTEVGDAVNNTEDSSIQGGGFMELRGIFFLPNANPFSVGGTSGGTISADAQFFVRKLANNGGVNFTMTVTPNNAIPVPFFASFSLVR